VVAFTGISYCFFLGLPKVSANLQLAPKAVCTSLQFFKIIFSFSENIKQKIFEFASKIIMAFSGYKLLNPNCFRLLRVLKGTTDPISCELSQHTLEPNYSGPDFGAVSYAWGGQAKPCEIILDGIKVAVTMNMYLALKDLRQPTNDRILWIDAVCIDQSNEKEQSQQVQQMGSIYSKAERVLVWLGESSYTTDCVMDLMKRVETVAIRDHIDCSSITLEQLASIWLMLTKDLTTDRKSLLRNGFQALLDREWFTRVWIIQETANAQRAEILCGKRAITANIFALMPSMLQITLGSQCESLLDIMPGTLRKNSWWSQKPDLRSLLIKFRNCKATDPRDHIYALLGISSNTSDNAFVTNYEISIEEVICHTTLFLLGVKLDRSDFLPLLFPWTLSRFLEILEDIDNEAFRFIVSSHHVFLVEAVIRCNAQIDFNMVINGEKPLFWAVKNGYQEATKLLLETGKVLINEIGHNGRTPLMLAVFHGHETITRMLLKTGQVSINYQDNIGQTPLMLAASHGYETITRMLLETGMVNVKLEDHDGFSAFYYAAARGSVNILRHLVEISAEETFTANPTSGYALLAAGTNGHVECVRYILEICTVDVNYKDKIGQTLLSYSAENGHENIVKLLFERHDIKIDTKDDSGRTPLCWAATNGHTDIVKMFICTGNVQLGGQKSPLTSPFVSAVWAGHQEIVRLLLETGEVDADLDYCVDNVIELIWGAQNGNTAMPEMLLKANKRDINVEDEKGPRLKLSRRTEAVLSAAFHGHTKVLDLLLTPGIMDINHADSWGKTALMNAAQGKQLESINYLLGYKHVNPNQRDAFGHTALWYAINQGIGVSELLETCKMDTEACNSAFARAISYDDIDTVKMMVETSKVDVRGKHDGQTPLELATGLGYTNIVEFLLLSVE
jgi:ankyrin repeat protein